MKILLTLFVLLFATPAHSSDDLTGNKIVCSKLDGELIYLTGFDFIGPSFVHHYQATNKSSLFVNKLYYETTPEKIMIEPNKAHEYNINRKNLSVTRYKEQYRNDSFQYKNGECRLYDASIQDFISKKLEKYKEGNLL